MVESKICLDTNAYSKMIRGDQEVVEIIESASSILMPVTVIAELYYGFRLGSKYDWNIELLYKFLNLSEVSVAPSTINTADLFSSIKMHLKISGNPIPINDIWIAACAIENACALLTFDAHFDSISGLRLFK